MHDLQLLGPILFLRIVLGFATAISVFLWRRHVFWRCFALAGAVLIAISHAKNLYYLKDNFRDMGHFWRAGDAFRHGRDPYAVRRILNTPNTLPLFELFSLLPLPIMANLWKGFNLVGTLLLVPLSAWFVRLASGLREQRLSLGQIATLSALLTFSNASMENINWGQLHVLVALSVLGTLLLRECQHPGLAGLTASLAFFKINTALPLMPVFVNRKSDIKLVVVLGLSILTQTLIAAWPDKLPTLIAGDLQSIAALSSPGGGNDYAYTGPASAGIVSVNHWLYRLGLTDRDLIGKLQLAASLALGAGLTWMVRSQKLSQRKSVAVFCLYSITFLYHRIYDSVLLALPLVYALDQYQQITRKLGRQLILLAGLAIVGVLYTPESVLYTLSKNPTSLSWLARAVVLPLPFWLIFMALGLMLIVDDENRGS